MPPVSKEVDHSVLEIPEGPVQIPHLRQYTHGAERMNRSSSRQGKAQSKLERQQASYQVKWQPIVGKNNDKEDKVDTEMQHVCQELKIEHIDSLQSDMAKLRVPQHTKEDHRLRK